MEAEFSRRTLVTPAEMRALTERSDLRGGVQMASHLGAILCVGWLHAQAMGTWWVVPTGLVLGVLINFLYAAQHELSHATVFATRRLNAWFGRAVGFVLLFPRDFDQVMHFAHHQWTQDWARDGELVREPYTLTSYLLWLSGITYWRNRVTGIVRRARGVIVEPYIKPADAAKVTSESRMHLAGYALIVVLSVLFQSWAAVGFWLLPMLLTKPVHQLQNTIEHLGLSHEPDILENTRSTRAGPLIRWLTWQMPYHTAHHTFPAVPFWKLRALDEKIEAKAGTLHRMGWIEFQIAVIGKLRAKDESQYPSNDVWVAPRAGGRALRLQIE